METTDFAELINEAHKGTWAEQLGLIVTLATRDEVRATVTIQPKHHQPYGLVHGGVYCSIIESIASIGAGIDAMPRGQTIVGVENNTSFVRAAREGTLQITGTPITRGRRTQLWEVTLRNESGQICSTGRVRLLVLEPDAEVAGEKLKMP